MAQFLNDGFAKALALAAAAGDLSSAAAGDLSANSAASGCAGQQPPLFSPPVSNTGGETSKPSKQAPKAAIIDYVRFSCSDPDRLDFFLLHYGGGRENWQMLETGRHFYTKTYVSGHMRIYTDGMQEGMGFCVELSGQACREFEATCCHSIDPETGEYVTKVTNSPWQAHLRLLCSIEEIQFTRLDVALDDRTGMLDLSQIADMARNDQYTCRSGSLSIVESKKRGKKGTGMTITFGKRDTGTRVLRFYDKLAEQISKKKPVEGDFWVRCELEAIDERANLLARMLSEYAKPEDQLKAVCGIIREFVDFKEGEEALEKNKWRLPSCQWWLDFLSGWEKVPLTLAPLVRTLAKKQMWISRQVCVSLAVCYESAASGKQMLADYIQEGKARMRPRDWEMVNSARRAAAKHSVSTAVVDF